VALYARAELKVLLGLAGALLVGLGAREWRAGFPEHADHLERFDRDPAAARPADAADPAARPGAAPARRPRGPEPCAPPRSDAKAVDGTPAPIDGQRPLDINRASVGELARLPGVGPSLASRIVASRERDGAFASSDALRRVLGVGPRKLAAIRALVTAGDDSNRTAFPAAPGAVADEERPEGEPYVASTPTPADMAEDVDVGHVQPSEMDDP
jgi:competence ComEA-like helix-hairpin-helix protein